MQEGERPYYKKGKRLHKRGQSLLSHCIVHISPFPQSSGEWAGHVIKGYGVSSPSNSGCTKMHTSIEEA